MMGGGERGKSGGGSENLDKSGTWQERDRRERRRKREMEEHFIMHHD